MAPKESSADTSASHVVPPGRHGRRQRTGATPQIQHEGWPLKCFLQLRQRARAAGICQLHSDDADAVTAVFTRRQKRSTGALRPCDFLAASHSAACAVWGHLHRMSRSGNPSSAVDAESQVGRQRGMLRIVIVAPQAVSAAAGAGPTTRIATGARMARSAHGDAAPARHRRELPKTRACVSPGLRREGNRRPLRPEPRVNIELVVARRKGQTFSMLSREAFCNSSDGRWPYSPFRPPAAVTASTRERGCCGPFLCKRIVNIGARGKLFCLPGRRSRRLDQVKPAPSTSAWRRHPDSVQGGRGRRGTGTALLQRTPPPHVAGTGLVTSPPGSSTAVK